MIRRGLLFVIAVLHGAVAQDSCISPRNIPGRCINVHSCQRVINILQQQKPLSSEIVLYLKSLQCGTEGNSPKVCCEQQQTPAAPTPTIQSPIPSPPDVSNHPNLRLLNEDICGPATVPKLIGGERTGVLDFPWMALVAYDTGNGIPEFRCGGTVINKRYVMTAAHCVTSLPRGVRVVGVRLGEHDLDSERDCDRDETGREIVCADPPQNIDLESVHTHPGFSVSQMRNDIALLRLNRNADFAPLNVRPICMPLGTAALFNQKKVTVTGWGVTELKVPSQSLLKVKLDVVNSTECERAIKGKTRIWHKHICAGGRRGMNSCGGDSGGPLQSPNFYNNKVKYIQYGIVSVGFKRCDTEGVPGIYTNVVYYMDWILDTIRP
ncbi:CLIP domain-containing serine protease B4-like [Hylaeus anthracinus]|uniref:CLIP domain-containing serine protease B4-like n=1 Tax=Hylaeus anthracinus TaxID=313031 RepID=UPI0023BA1793|nr:CLIP domain-containing serine protease B4-like [Hylaeus anthracinus]